MFGVILEKAEMFFLLFGEIRIMDFYKRSPVEYFSVSKERENWTVPVKDKHF